MGLFGGMHLEMWGFLGEKHLWPHVALQGSAQQFLTAGSPVFMVVVLGGWLH